MLSPGVSGQVLQTQGAGANPKWSGGVYTPNVYQGSLKNPSATTSTSLVMMGMAGSFTPSSTGDVFFTVSGSLLNINSNHTCNLSFYYGTGATPSNGVAQSGTQIGAPVAITVGTGGSYPFSCMGIVTGLTLSTAYWLDVALSGTSGSTVSVVNAAITAFEIK